MRSASYRPDCQQREARRGHIAVASPVSVRWHSQEPRWPHHSAPHMRGRAVVEAQPFLWLLEVAADDVDEVVEVYLRVRIERIDIIERDQSRRHVPLVVPGSVIL